MHTFGTLEKWLQQEGWQLAESTKLSGGHAADLYQLGLRDAESRLFPAIYKKLAPTRESEIFLYQNILGELPIPVPKLLGILEAGDEKGLLIEYGGEVLKKFYAGCKLAEKRHILADVISELAHLHVASETKAQAWISSGTIFPYPYESSVAWGQSALDELAGLAGEPGGLISRQAVGELRNIAANFYPQYPAWTAGRTTLTHGDPHLENILLGPDGYCFIDWEWTCVSIPQRDLAILLQDVVEPELHMFVWDEYTSKLAACDWESRDPLFAIGFYASMVDNTLMMLGWDIQKFRNGFLTRVEIEEVLQRKINWIREYYDMVVQ